VSYRWREDRGRWEVKWREHGRQRSRLFRFEQDAKDFDNELYRRRRMGFTLPFDRGSEPLSAWGEEAWPVYFVPRLSENTRAQYAIQWDKHVLPALGDVSLRDLDAGRVSRFAADLRRRKVGEPTIRVVLGILSRMLRYAVQEGKIASNPVLVVDKPRQHDREWPDPVTPETVERIRVNMRNARDRMIVTLLGYQGLRPQELRRADWRHVQGNRLRVYAPKTRRNRTVDLLKPVVDELEQWRQGRRQGPVIPGADGRTWTEQGYRNWRRTVWDERAVLLLDGEDTRPYRLRGSFASLLAWEGRPITYVARQLGHSVQTCSRYYLGVFDTVDMAQAVPASDAILAARARVLAADGSVPHTIPNGGERGA
jgi:integrase